jgi:hypothetical protein
VFSFINARIAGLIWYKTKSIGGINRFMTWTGSILATIGFTWCYLLCAAFALEGAGYLTSQTTKSLSMYGHIFVLVLIVFSGFFVLVEVSLHSTAFYTVTNNLEGLYGYGLNMSEILQKVTISTKKIARSFLSILQSVTDEVHQENIGSTILIAVTWIITFIFAAGIIITVAIIKAYSDDELVSENAFL